MTHPAESTPPPNDITAAASPRRGRFALRLVGFVLMGIAFLILFYGAIAYVAWRRGEEARVERLTEQRQTTLARQLELAQEDVTGGNFELALRRLDYVLGLDPSNPEALALQGDAQTGQQALLNPTATPTVTPQPTVTPTVAAQNTVVASSSDAAAAFAILEELVDAQRWSAAAEAAEKFRATYPDYRRRDVDEWLYDSYIGYGLTLTRGVEIERGLVFLRQAAELGDLSEEVLGEIFWAEQYLAGIVFYDIDWSAYLSYFRPMCEFAPLYQDSCGKLAEGLLRYGDQQAAVAEYCPAEALYREALATGEVENSEERLEALTLFTEFCAVATPTPTPEPTLDATNGITNTEAVPDNRFDPLLLTPTP